MKEFPSPQYKRVKKLAPALKEILPVMFKNIGLTMTNVRIGNSGWNVFFRIKEFSQRLHFDYDGFCIEISVYHHGQHMDYLLVVGVPWVYKKDGKFYAHWTALRRLGGPYNSIEKLMKRYLQGRLRQWIKTMLPETSVHMYRSIGSKEDSWARIVNSQNPPRPDESADFLGKINIWK